MIQIAFLIFIIYVGFIITRYPHLESISGSFYEFEKTKKGLGALFIFWAWSQVFLLIPYLLENTPYPFQIFAFLPCLGLGFVGAAPFFKDLSQSKIHFAGAGICLLGSLAWIIAFNPFVYTLISLIIYTFYLILYIFMPKKLVLLIELAAFTALYIVIL